MGFGHTARRCVLEDLRKAAVFVVANFTFTHTGLDQNPMRNSVLWRGGGYHAANAVCLDSIVDEPDQRLTGDALAPKSS